jgi:hypothetical protein
MNLRYSAHLLEGEGDPRGLELKTSPFEEQLERAAPSPSRVPPNLPRIQGAVPRRLLLRPNSHVAKTESQEKQRKDKLTSLHPISSGGGAPWHRGAPTGLGHLMDLLITSRQDSKWKNPRFPPALDIAFLRNNPLATCAAEELTPRTSPVQDEGAACSCTAGAPREAQALGRLWPAKKNEISAKPLKMAADQGPRNEGPKPEACWQKKLPLAGAGEGWCWRHAASARGAWAPGRAGFELGRGGCAGGYGCPGTAGAPVRRCGHDPHKPWQLGWNHEVHCICAVQTATLHRADDGCIGRRFFR